MDSLTDAYTQLLDKLLPRGPAWSQHDRLLSGLAPSLAAAQKRVDELVPETDPRSTTELIDRWEAICGLPDSCAPPGVQTLAQRQQRLDAKVNLVGGITEDFYLQQLSALGYPDATITRFYKDEFLCTSPCINALYSDDWNFYWQVNMPVTTRVTDMTCLGSCTDSLRTWGDTVAECVIHKLCPSHTIVLFSYPSEANSAPY